MTSDHESALSEPPSYITTPFTLSQGVPSVISSHKPAKNTRNLKKRIPRIYALRKPRRRKGSQEDTPQDSRDKDNKNNKDKVDKSNKEEQEMVYVEKSESLYLKTPSSRLSIS